MAANKLPMAGSMGIVRASISLLPIQNSNSLNDELVDKLSAGTIKNQKADSHMAVRFFDYQLCRVAGDEFVIVRPLSSTGSNAD